MQPKPSLSLTQKDDLSSVRLVSEDRSLYYATKRTIDIVVSAIGVALASHAFDRGDDFPLLSRPDLVCPGKSWLKEAIRWKTFPLETGELSLLQVSNDETERRPFHSSSVCAGFDRERRKADDSAAR